MAARRLQGVVVANRPARTAAPPRRDQPRPRPSAHHLLAGEGSGSCGGLARHPAPLGGSPRPQWTLASTIHPHCARVRCAPAALARRARCPRRSCPLTKPRLDSMDASPPPAMASHLAMTLTRHIIINGLNTRHARARRGHHVFAAALEDKTWMAGTSPAMTESAHAPPMPLAAASANTIA